MPLGVVGLIPDGSTKVSWRWMGQVFEDSPDDILTTQYCRQKPSRIRCRFYRST